MEPKLHFYSIISYIVLFLPSFVVFSSFRTKFYTLKYIFNFVSTIIIDPLLETLIF